MAGTTTPRQNAALDAVAEGLRADARSFAAQVRALAELSDLADIEARESGMRQFPMMELAGSARLGSAAATRRLAEADRIVTTLPVTLRLLDEGELLVHQARVVLAETASCEPEVARRVEAQVLAEAVGLCPADLRKALRRTVLRVESELDAAREDEQQLAEQRLADARAERRTWTSDEPNGMGVASALMTAEQLRRWQLDLDQLELQERVADRAAGIDRTADQRRADLCAALPGMVLEARRTLARARSGRGSGAGAGPSAQPARTTSPEAASGSEATNDDGRSQPATALLTLAEQLGAGTSSAPPARVVLNILVPMATILDLSREPAGIDGIGPISAEHVRLLRPAGFRGVMVDSVTGQPLHVDDHVIPADPDPVVARRQVLDLLRPVVVTDAAEPQHDPSAALARLVDLRDARCAGPGCSHAVCHRDHTEPYPAGPTAAWNLRLLSARCHQAKHQGWTLVHHPDGSTTWTSPLGRTYDRPPAHPRPPRIDPDAELPPLRPPPTAAAPWWSRDERPPAAADPPPHPRPDDEPSPALPDEPPF